MEFEHDAERHRYLLRVDGVVASALDYADDGAVVAMTRTFTNPTFRRQGYGAKVVAHAVDDVAARGRRVRPTCWFVAEWFDDHPEHQAVLAGGRVDEGSDPEGKLPDLDSNQEPAG